MELGDLYDMVYGVLRAEGWDVEHNLELFVTKNVPGLVMGEILPGTWSMKITVDDELDVKIKSLMQRYGLHYENPANKMVYSAVQHEKGHWSVCPSAVQYIWDIYSGVSRGLNNIGFSKEQIERYTPYIANIFEDTVVNVRYKGDPRFVDGRYLMFMSRLESAKNASVVFEGEIDEWMSLFIDVQARLIGRNAQEREIVKGNFSRYNELSKFSVGLLSAFTGRELAEKIFNGTATEKERNLAVLAVRESANWSRASQLYAELLGPFVLNAKELPEINSYDRYAVGGPEPQNGNERQILKNRPEPEDGQSKANSTKPLINMNMPPFMPPGPMFKSPKGNQQGMNMPFGASAAAGEDGNDEKNQQAQGAQGNESQNSDKSKDKASAAVGKGKGGKHGQKSSEKSNGSGEGGNDENEDSDSAGNGEASKNSRSGRGSKNDRDTGEEEQENAAEPSENTGKDKATGGQKKEQQGEAANSEDGNNAHNGGLGKITALLSKIKNAIEGKADKNDSDQNAESKAGKEEEKNDGNKDNKNKGNNPKDPNESMKKQNNQDKEPNFFTVNGIDRKNREKEKDKNNGALRGEVLGYGIGRGADEPAMLWVPHVEAVRETYERNATQTVLEFLKDDNNKKIMPSGSVIYTARRVEDEKNLPYARIDYGKTRFVPGEGGGEDMWMYEKRQLSPRADMPENLQPTSFKDLLFIVDTSGSMLWTGKALDGFEYDLAVRSVFSILKYLEYTKKAAYLNYGLIQFSSHTYFSGWKDFNHIKELKNALIERYEGGGTEFNPDALYLAASQKSDKFLAILISDTWIYNDTETIEAFKNVMREGNDVAILQIGGFAKYPILQIGGSAKFTRNLEPLSVELARSGATVRLLTNPNDLVNLSLKITKERYVERTESGIRGFAVNEHIKV